MSLQANPEPLTITVPEAAVVLGVSRSHAYDLAHTDELPTIRLGHRLVVPAAALRALLESDHDAPARTGAQPCCSRQASYCVSSSAAKVVATCTSCGSTAWA